MASQTNSIPGSGYNNAYLDSLIWGCGWTNYSDSPIKYYFASGACTDGSIGNFTGDAWSIAEISAFTTAIANYASVCNLKFTQASTSSSANIAWWQAPGSKSGDPMYGLLGMHEVPNTAKNPIYGYFNYQTSIWNNLSVGSYGYITIIHELGHAMGLAHPHDGGTHSDATTFPGVTYKTSTDLGDYSMNQGIWTTMSYNDGWNLHPSGSYNYGWQGTLMALDIAALQALYGANMTTATGDNTYYLPTVNAAGTYWSCIWDAGGTDTISNAGSSIACTIDLRDAPLTGENAGGYVSWNNSIIGGFTIAHNAIIENAVGGNGNDNITGNSSNNTLSGNAGDDTLYGGGGDDTFNVGDSGDSVIENAGEGTDLVNAWITYTLGANVENLTLQDGAAINGYGNSLNNVITGNSSNNTLSGNAGDDTLYGGGGDDYILGGTGNDTLYGGAGNDTFNVGDSGDSVIENAGEGTDLVNAWITYTLGANVENLTLQDGAAINGYGNSLNNVITGNSSNNTLSGNAGNDILYGGGGNDIFVFNTTLNASTNVDSIQEFISANDQIYLDHNIFSSLATGALADANFTANASGTAQDLNDRIIYNTSSGALFYDSDGNGVGAAIKFAELTGSPAISAVVFSVF